MTITSSLDISEPAGIEDQWECHGRTLFCQPIVVNHPLSLYSAAHQPVIIGIQQRLADLDARIAAKKAKRKQAKS